MLNGVLDLPWWGVIVATLVLTHITIVSVTIYLHRYQAHRAIEVSPVVGHFFRFWLWLTTSMITKQWVAVHRKHHAKCETDQDPHSPIAMGINTVLWKGAELYRNEADNNATLNTYGHKTPDDWLENNLYSGRTNKLGIAIMLVLNVVMFGPIGITVWAIQMAWIPFWAAGIINGAGHYVGYRNFEVSDASTNLVPWGIIIGGEELHNNHHAFGSSAKFSVKKWEFDIGWMYIQILQFLGLAKVKKVAPQPRLDANKSEIDNDTVMALVANRFQVMSNYARQVVKNVYKEEVTRTRDGVSRFQLKRARKLLTRDSFLMDPTSKENLAKALSSHQTLDVVYDFRQRLEAIWQKTADSQEQLLAAIQEWCRQAEETGITALQDFAQSLKNYSLAPQAV